MVTALVVATHLFSIDVPRPLSPAALFERVSGCVVVVEALDVTGVPEGQGSGVCTGNISGPGRVITNAHVLDGAVSVRVRRGSSAMRAWVTRLDTGLDLAELKVEGLVGPELQRRSAESLKIGERVYAVGAPQGLELTLSDGLISSLREVESGLLVQTTAPLSPGSSGGGLFDESGQLIGITTFQFQGQNLNFALSMQWVDALSRRPTSDSALADRLRTGKSWIELSRRYEGLGRIDAAAKAVRRAVDFGMSPVFALEYLGKLYERAQRLDQAIAAFEEAILIAPNDFRPMRELCRVSQSSVGKPVTETVALCRRVTVLAPGDADAWTLLSKSLHREALHHRGRTPDRIWREASAAARKAIGLAPRSAEAWEQFALASMALGDFDSLIGAWCALRPLSVQKAESIEELIAPSLRRCH